MGQQGPGALTYTPHHHFGEVQPSSSVLVRLSDLRDGIQQMLQGEATEVLETLLSFNSSLAGARPKAHIALNTTKTQIIHGACSPLPEGFEPWIVKFPAATDRQDVGAMEYVYALMAKHSGIHMPEVHLFPPLTAHHQHSFASERFDCKGPPRIHAHTACGLLHSPMHIHSLDYRHLMKLTMALTQDHRHFEQMYRRAVFNVLAHNRDDHGKNVSFLMTACGTWTLSPGYDLTFSAGPGGEHSTTVMGEGRSPGKSHLQALGREAGLSQKTILAIIEQTRSALSHWQAWAQNHHVATSTIRAVNNALRKQDALQ